MDTYDVLFKRIVKLENEVKRLKNVSAPTVPIYDPTNFPQDAINGQVAIGSDDTAWKYVNDAWSEIGGGGGLTAEWMQYSFDNGVTVAGGGAAGQCDWLESLQFPPFGSGQSPGLMDMTDEFNPRLNVPGLYFFMIRVACATAMTSGKSFGWEFRVATDFGGSPLDSVTYINGNSPFATGGINGDGYGAEITLAAMAIAPAAVVASPYFVLMRVANNDTVSRTFWIDRAEVFRLTPATTIA
jgi:hypothetical protein